LAVDPKTGDLWFVIFTYNGATNELYHYDSGSATLEKRSIPASSGSEFFSAIAVDGRGHVISAEGNMVLDIDPAGGYTELRLPEPANYVRQPGWDGTYVIDMALSPDGTAYLSRMNTAAITVLNLDTGQTNEIPVSPSLGQFYFIELAGDQLWMTTWADTSVAPSQTAVLNLENAQTELTQVKSVAIAADDDGNIYTSVQGSGGLSRMDSNSAAAEPLAVSSEGLNGLRDFVEVDSARGIIWMAGGSGIVSLAPSTGKEERYRLPSWTEAETAPLSIPAPCLLQECNLSGPATTTIGGIAVASNGDLYFSDKSFNRIGIVHPR